MALRLKEGKVVGYHSGLQAFLEEEHGRKDDEIDEFLKRLVANGACSLVSCTRCSQRSILSYGALVWWRAIQKRTYLPALDKIQKSACLGITVALKSTMHAGLEVIFCET